MRNVRMRFVLLALAAFGCGAEQGPPPECAVESSRDMGALEQAAAIRGRDGGYSALLWERSVWLYGDTMLDVENEYGSRWLNNSWSWTQDGDASDGISGFVEPADAAGAPAELLPQTAEERAFNLAHQGDACQVEPCGARWALWPGALAADPERDRALVFYSKVYAEPGEWNFEGVGSSIAIWRGLDAQPERPVVDAGAEHPTLLFGAGEPSFGSAALIEDGLLYAYACGTDGLAKDCLLGRVPADRALERGAWRYYAGEERGWVADWQQAEPVLEANDILSVAYNRHLQAYLAVYSQPMDAKTMLRTAPRPEGPWSASLHAFDALPPENDTGWVYDALPHPELEQQEGRIQYVTYSRATGDFLSELRVVELVLR